MILAARPRIHLGAGSLNGDLGIFLAACMKAAVYGELTGAMILTDRHFLAVVEGHMDTLKTAFDRLGEDGRLETLKSLECVPVGQRQFRTWAVTTCDRTICSAAVCTRIEAGTIGTCEVHQLVRRCLAQGRLAESPPLVAAA